jgi:outer membrane biosynthesis protein TonB
MAAQSEPTLVSANIPIYPPLALQARIEGIVKLTFTLGPTAAEPMKIQAVSGHTALKGAAVESVKTWRLQNPGGRSSGGTKQRSIIGFFLLARKELPLSLLIEWKSSVSLRCTAIEGS